MLVYQRKTEAFWRRKRIILLAIDNPFTITSKAVSNFMCTGHSIVFIEEGEKAVYHMSLYCRSDSIDHD